MDCNLGTGGCNGGWMDETWQHQSTFGIFTETEYRYRENDDTLPDPVPEWASSRQEVPPVPRQVCPYCKRKPGADSVRPKVWGRVKGDPTKGISATDAMIQAINKYGPLPIALTWSDPKGASLADYK